METAGESRKTARRGGIGRSVKIAGLLVEHVFDVLIDAIIGYARIVWLETELFLGATLALVGLLSFSNGKNCDGNTADYLSCTHPSTYYYYGALEITLIVIGVFFVLMWFLKRREKKVRRA